MKKIVSLLAVLCLLLGCVSVASAAIQITQQPETQTVKAGGNVTFTVKAKGVNGSAITWYFTNPETGETTTGKKLSSVVKGVKVQNPNSLKITLKKVPEAMHGWTMHAHIGRKTGGVDTDEVMILIAGLEPPEDVPAAAPKDEEDTKETADTKNEDSKDTKDTAKNTGKNSGKNSGSKGSDEPAVTPEPQIVYVTPEPPGPIVITANGKATELYLMDSKGQVVGDAVSELTFEAGKPANFYVKMAEGTEGTLAYVTVGNTRLIPEGEVTGMSVRGWETSATVKIKVNKGDEEPMATRVPVVEEDVDESQLVTVTCTNCRFTGWHNTYATTGKVPVGSTIMVFADSGLIRKGYTINGQDKQFKNQASFEFVVEEDTEISLEKQ